MALNNKDFLKSNLVIGGAQVVQMLTTIVRAKIIAILLGSVGMGLNAIFQSMMLTIYNIASCGIMQSGVREISQNNTEDMTRLGSTLSVFRILVLLASIVGFLICFLGAYPLSFISFGDSSNVSSFMILGLGVSFYILTHGEMTILQGRRQLVLLAKSSIIGSVISLIVCIPCYYYWGNWGIVLSILIGYALYWLVYRYFRKKGGTKISPLSLVTAIHQGRSMLTLGVVLMFGTFLVSFFTYLTNISIRILGSIQDVGFYQGAASITTQSIVVIIAILASDFYPRISALTKSRKDLNEAVNVQLSLVISLIMPIVALLICLAPYVVKLLLSEEFLCVVPVLQMMSYSLLFRGVWITMSYVILAYGDKKRYLIFDAVLGNGSHYIVNITCYAFGGLVWLGASYVIAAFLVCTILCIVVARFYSFSFSRYTISLLIIGLLLTGSVLLLYNFNAYLSMLLALIVCIISVFNLVKKFDIISILKKR